jgi:hypothetical protein
VAKPKPINGRGRPPLLERGETLAFLERRYRRAKAERAELDTARMRGNLGDIHLMGRVLFAQHRQARDVLMTAPSREAATFAAALGLEPRVVLPVLEDFVRRVLVNVRDAFDVEREFLAAMTVTNTGAGP